MYSEVESEPKPEVANNERKKIVAFSVLDGLITQCTVTFSVSSK